MPLNMLHFRSLSLHRCIFTAEELKSFLLIQTTTLRDLYVLACLCRDDETMLAEGGRQLSWKDGKFSGLLAFVDRKSPNPQG
jgi:hypothetical protein